MSGFDLFIGVDYSGAETPGSRLPRLQIYAARPGAAAPERWSSPTPSNNRQRVNWTRREIAERLRGEISDGACLLAGIDHGFSFPVSYFARYGLKTWPDFLADFTKYWPTHLDHVYVDFVRDGSLHRHGRGPRPGQRVGSADEFRLTERWTSSAKSVFQLDGQGTVGKSTHAGIPWLRWLREELGDAVHFWPFDGWTPPAGKAVIAEVYPSIFRNRYPREGRSADEHDAYATARWMAEMSARGALDSYFAPPLTFAERAIASLEGWILGCGERRAQVRSPRRRGRVRARLPQPRVAQPARDHARPRHERGRVAGADGGAFRTRALGHHQARPQRVPGGGTRPEVSMCKICTHCGGRQDLPGRRVQPGRDHLGRLPRQVRSRDAVPDLGNPGAA